MAHFKALTAEAERGDLFAARLDEYWSTYPDRNAGDNQFPVFNTGNVGQHLTGYSQLPKQSGKEWNIGFGAAILVKRRSACKGNASSSPEAGETWTGSWKLEAGSWKPIVWVGS